MSVELSGRRGGREKLLTHGGRTTAIAIGAALDWLAAHQDADGKWDADGFARHDARGDGDADGAGEPVVDVAVTAYALLAFLQDGSHPAGGPHRDVVRKGLVWLVARQDPATGRFGEPAHPRALQHHTAATLAVLEAYAHSGCEGLRPAAQRAVELLESEREVGGGWRLHTGREGDDAMATAWAVVARDAGLTVDRGAFGDAAAALRAAAGGEEPSLRSAAACLLGAFFAREQPDEYLERLAKRCVALAPAAWPDAEAMTWFAGSRAVYQTGGRPWLLWSRHLGACLEGQRTDGRFAGSWDPDAAWGAAGGRVYATALGALALESYYGYARLIVR